MLVSFLEERKNMMEIAGTLAAVLPLAGEPPASGGVLGNLGINWMVLLAQMLAFGIVYFAFNRFLFPQVRKALDERREAVAKTLEGKAEIETRLAEFSKEQAANQKKAAEDVQALMSDAKSQADKVKADLVAKAKEAADAEIAAAKKRIDAEKAAAEADVAKNAKNIAQSIVTQLLSEKSSDAKWQQEQLKAGIDALKKG
jgi:F-type H+-transporting ATPase subunit b